MTVHPNSKAAYNAVLASGVLTKQEKRAVTEIIRRGPGTNRELDKRIGHGGRSWHPTLHRLEKTGVLEVKQTRTCAVSGHMAMEYSFTGLTRPKVVTTPKKPPNSAIQTFLSELEDLADVALFQKGDTPSENFMEVWQWMSERYEEK